MSVGNFLDSLSQAILVGIMLAGRLGVLAVITTVTTTVIVVASITYTASCHNFKSLNFKLSVSNPNRKYVAYVSVLSQISNSQGLGRKNNFEILKTDRMRNLLDWLKIP